jgi:hypothetical protein
MANSCKATEARDVIFNNSCIKKIVESFVSLSILSLKCATVKLESRRVLHSKDSTHLKSVIYIKPFLNL